MRIFILFFILLAFISSARSENVNDAYIYATKFKKKVVRQEKVSPPSCPKCQDSKQVSKPKVPPSLPKGIGCPKCIEHNPKPKTKIKTKTEVTPNVPKSSTVNKNKPTAIKGSYITLEVLSGSINQEKLFCNYSSYIYLNIKNNISTKTFNEDICPPIIVEFVLHKNGEISNVKIISYGENKASAKELFDAVSKVDLKNLPVALPSNASSYAKARVFLKGYLCRKH